MRKNKTEKKEKASGKIFQNYKKGKTNGRCTMQVYVFAFFFCENKRKYKNKSDLFVLLSEERKKKNVIKLVRSGNVGYKLSNRSSPETGLVKKGK